MFQKCFGWLSIDGFNVLFGSRTWKKEYVYLLHLLSYIQQNLQFLLRFTQLLSLTYLPTQISFEKPFWWRPMELWHEKEGEIHMCDWALLRLLATPFVSYFLSIKRIRILFRDRLSLTLSDFALLIFDLLCNQFVGNKSIHL